MVNWGTLVATALGAILGTGSTLAVDRSRWRRDHRSREYVARRELYGQYLASLSLATHQLRDLRRPGALTGDERMRRVGEALSESGAYQLRYQMLITAPDALEGPIEEAFSSVRRLRDRFDEPDVCTDPQWDSSLDAVSEAIRALKRAMRDDLAASP